MLALLRRLLLAAAALPMRPAREHAISKFCDEVAKQRTGYASVVDENGGGEHGDGGSEPHEHQSSRQGSLPSPSQAAAEHGLQRAPCA